MLQVFSIDFYDLLNLGATMSFVNPLVARKFDVLLDIFSEPFLIVTLVGDSVVDSSYQ